MTRKYEQVFTNEQRDWIDQTVVQPTLDERIENGMWEDFYGQFRSSFRDASATLEQFQGRVYGIRNKIRKKSGVLPKKKDINPLTLSEDTLKTMDDIFSSMTTACDRFSLKLQEELEHVKRKSAGVIDDFVLKYKETQRENISMKNQVKNVEEELSLYKTEVATLERELLRFKRIDERERSRHLINA